MSENNFAEEVASLVGVGDDMMGSVGSFPPVRSAGGNAPRENQLGQTVLPNHSEVKEKGRLPHDERRDRNADDYEGTPHMAIEKDYIARGGLAGDKAPPFIKKSESTRDRMMVMMKFSGTTNKDIARQLGCSAVTVSNTLRQPWARRRLISMMEEVGQDTITSLVHGELENSLYKLVEIRDDKNAGARNQLVAASTLIDRAMGKAPQYIETRSGKLDATETSELDKDIAAQEAEIKRLQGTA